MEQICGIDFKIFISVPLSTLYVPNAPTEEEEIQKN